MNRRIKTVWALSIITMALIFGAQAYWLLRQFEYMTDLHAEQLKAACTDALEKEQALRIDSKLNHKDSVKTRQDTITVKVERHDNYKKTGGHKSQTYVSVTTNGKTRNVYLKGVDNSANIDLSFRYLASETGKLSQRYIDSALTASGYGTTRQFRFYKDSLYMKKPLYTRGGTFGNHVNVRYSTNPIIYEAVAFSIDIRPSAVLRSMGWQLAGSVVLMLALAFCLAYQMKTILIQKRIDGIRHEFMKNMVYEMKQPPTVEPADNEAVSIGDTAFYYTLNELRHGTDKTIITSRQAEILRLLAERKNEAVSREELLTEVWGDDSYSNSMALNVQITYLRRALKPDPKVSIEAVIKKGYVLKVMER